jgi:hypothetical protein
MIARLSESEHVKPSPLTVIASGVVLLGHFDPAISNLTKVIEKGIPEEQPLVSCCFCCRTATLVESHQEEWLSDFYVAPETRAGLASCGSCASEHIQYLGAAGFFLKAGHEDEIQPPRDEIYDSTWVGPNDPAERLAWIEGNYPKWGQWLRIKFSGPITEELVKGLMEKAKKNVVSLKDLAYRLGLKGENVPGDFEDMIIRALKQNPSDHLDSVLSLTYDQYYGVGK